MFQGGKRRTELMKKEGFDRDSVFDDGLLGRIIFVCYHAWSRLGLLDIGRFARSCSTRRSRHAFRSPFGHVDRRCRRGRGVGQNTPCVADIN